MAKTSEIAAAKPPALVAATDAEQFALVGGLKVKVKKEVTVPTLKQETGQTVFIQITDPIRQETTEEKKKVKVEGVDTEITEEKTINVVRVNDLRDNGRAKAYVLNAIAASELRDAYPNDGYVNLYFAITKGGTVAGKRYKDVTVVEIDVETPAEPTEAEQAEITGNEPA